jgi:Fe-S cluster assembly protein SufD
MIVVEQKSDWLNTIKAGLGTRQEPSSGDWLERIRNSAIQALKDEPLPVRKMEGWRYTPVNRLFNLPLNALPAETINALDNSTLFSKDIDSYKVIIANGRAEFLGSMTGDIPEGVVISTLHEALLHHKHLVSMYFGKAMNASAQESEKFTVPSQSKDSKVFQYLNQSLSPDGLFIYIPEGLKLDKPVELVNLNSGIHDDLIQSHGIVILAANSELTLVEQHIGKSSADQFCNHQLEIFIENDAVMKHYYFQKQGVSNWQRYGIHRIQDQGSNYSGWFGCFGSQWSRLEMDVTFKGQDAVSELQGIQLANDAQTNDIHIDVNHAQPGCHSEQHFRGLAMGKGKIVFDGKIRVAPDAQKTAAHLSDKNLMLSRHAEVDTKPQLEIYADDVQCSHGTSIGEIDEQQIFYLCSRGLSEDRARNLLSMGFVAEMIDSIDLDCFKNMVTDMLDKRFSVTNGIG